MALLLTATPLIGPALQLYYLTQHLFDQAAVGGEGYRTSQIPFNTITPQLDENGVPYDDFWSYQISFLMLFAQLVMNASLANYIQILHQIRMESGEAYAFAVSHHIGQAQTRKWIKRRKQDKALSKLRMICQTK